MQHDRYKKHREHVMGLLSEGNAPQTYDDAVSAAASLFDPQDCIAGFGAYTRGICEVIARTFPKIGVATDERSEEVMTDVQAMVTEGRCYDR